MTLMHMLPFLNSQLEMLLAQLYPQVLKLMLHGIYYINQIIISLVMVQILILV